MRRSDEKSMELIRGITRKAEKQIQKMHSNDLKIARVRVFPQYADESIRLRFPALVMFDCSIPIYRFFPLSNFMAFLWTYVGFSTKISMTRLAQNDIENICFPGSEQNVGLRSTGPIARYGTGNRRSTCQRRMNRNIHDCDEKLYSNLWNRAITRLTLDL